MCVDPKRAGRNRLASNWVVVVAAAFERDNKILSLCLEELMQSLVMLEEIWTHLHHPVIKETAGTPEAPAVPADAAAVRQAIFDDGQWQTTKLTLV